MSTHAADPALDRIVHGAHHDPHSVLGPHLSPDGLIVRTLRPWARSVVVVVGPQRHPLTHEREGVFAGLLPYHEVVDYRIEVGLRRRPGPHRRPLPPPAHRRPARPAPDLRGPARAALGRPRRPPAHLRLDRRAGDRGVLRGLGAQRPGHPGRRRLQPLGRPGPPHALAGVHGRLGAVRPRDRRRHALQVRDPRPRRRAPAEGRPDGPGHRGPAADRLQGVHLPVRVGRRRLAGPPRVDRRAQRTDERVRGAPRPPGGRGSPRTARSPTSSPRTARTSGSPTSS